MALQNVQKDNALSTKPLSEGKITVRILEQVEALQKKGALTLPPNYDAGNALNSAYLQLQTVVNKDSKPIMKNGVIDTSVVTLESVANALLDYVIQSLNCMKKQCYWIVYGNQLTCQRSVWGDVHVAQLVAGNIVPYMDVIYDGEPVEIVKIWSSTYGLIDTIQSHVKPFPRKTGALIIGGYCGFVNADTGENMGCIIMDMERIRKSWLKSPTYKYSTKEKPSPHDIYTDEYALRTLARRRTKPIINMSDDKLLLSSVSRQADDAFLAEIADEVDEHANGQILSLNRATGEIIDHEAVEEPEHVGTAVASAAPAGDVAKAKATEGQPEDDI
jgi:recombination protein RecT